VTEVVVTLLSVPQVVPLQPLPEIDHVTPALAGSLATLAEKPWPWFCCTLAVGGETLTETTASTVTLADPERVGSAPEVAVMVTTEPGGDAGAVYSPVLLIVPTVVLPPATPFTLHLTPRFCELFCTVAANCCVRETFTEAEAGETDTLISAAMEIVADALLVASATEEAVKVTVAGLGTFEGAL
jgi:hypothetical protein